MINYNWNCKTVDAYPKEADKTDVVYNVHWIVTGVSDQLDPDDNPYTARIIGTQLLDISDITGFIPFDQLTNEKITEWTKTAMGSEEVSSIESGIKSSIESLIAPTSVTLTIE
tara:strand:- start:2292 stop:2630 length:339 start_codon:yes stop_codon:yes gene_type:complete